MRIQREDVPLTGPIIRFPMGMARVRVCFCASCFSVFPFLCFSVFSVFFLFCSFSVFWFSVFLSVHAYKVLAVVLGSVGALLLLALLAFLQRNHALMLRCKQRVLGFNALTCCVQGDESEVAVVRVPDGMASDPILPRDYIQQTITWYAHGAHASAHARTRARTHECANAHMRTCTQAGGDTMLFTVLLSLTPASRTKQPMQVLRPSAAC